MVENLSMEVIVLKAIVSSSSGHQTNLEPSHQDTQTNATVSAPTQGTSSTNETSGPDEGDRKFIVVIYSIIEQSP